MRIPLILMASALALAGCASTGGDKVAACDGKHRRPANLYGSVLTPKADTPADAAKPKAVSAIDGASFASCRA